MKMLLLLSVLLISASSFASTTEIDPEPARLFQSVVCWKGSAYIVVNFKENTIAALNSPTVNFQSYGVRSTRGIAKLSYNVIETGSPTYVFTIKAAEAAEDAGMSDHLRTFRLRVNLRYGSELSDGLSYEDVLKLDNCAAIAN